MTGAVRGKTRERKRYCTIADNAMWLKWLFWQELMPLVYVAGQLVQFAHVPRCAGSAVEDYLAARFGPIGFLDRSYLLIPPAERWSISSPQHLPAEAFDRLIPSSWIAHCFAIVRHPEDRLVSVFRFQRDIQRTIDPGTIFEDWVARLPEQRENFPYALDNHTRPADDIIPEAATVFRLEDGLEAVVRWLDGIEAAERLPREILPKNGYEFLIAQPSRVPGPPVVVTPAVRRLIAGLYDVDFSRFGYAPYHEEEGTTFPCTPIHDRSDTKMTGE